MKLSGCGFVVVICLSAPALAAPAHAPPSGKAPPSWDPAAPLPDYHYGVSATDRGLDYGEIARVTAPRLNDVACTSRGEVLGVVDVIHPTPPEPVAAPNVLNVLLPNLFPPPAPPLRMIKAKQHRLWKLHPTPGPHPVNRILDDMKHSGRLSISNDGEWLAIDEPGPLRLIDLRNGKTKAPARALEGKFTLERFSGNGRFSSWQRHVGKNLDVADVVIFDHDKGTTVSLDDAARVPLIGPDGSWAGVEKKDGTHEIVDIATGARRYPKNEGDAPVASSSGALSRDGRLLSLEVTVGGKRTLRIFEVPAFRKVRDFPSRGRTADAGLFSDDGKLFFQSSLSVDPATFELHIEHTAHEIASGTRLALPSDRLITPCGDSHLWVRRNWDRDDEGLLSSSEVSISNRPPIPRTDRIAYTPARVPALLRQAAAHDPSEAFRALESLRLGPVPDDKAIDEALADSKRFSDADTKLVASLVAKLGNESYPVRQQASADTRLLIGRLSRESYEEKLLPTLRLAARNADAEVRRRALELLAIPPGIVSRDILAERLRPPASTTR